MAFATKPKQRAHQKKRVGAHRTQSKQYIKHYWPYLPMLLIVGLGLMGNSWLSRSPAVLGASSDLSQVTLLNDTNAQRSDGHEKSLRLNNQLTNAAQTKALDMVAGNYWSHDTPDGKTPWSFIVSSGYDYQNAGENLAYGFSDAGTAVQAWMNSPEHRANILNASYQQVGFGVAQSKDYVGKGPQTVIVAMYALPASATRPVYTAASGNTAVKGDSTVASPISRVQLLARAQSSIILIITIAAAGAASFIFVVRHGRAWHRVLVRGESFVLHHPLLDIAAVAVATSALLLSQAAGFVL